MKKLPQHIEIVRSNSKGLSSMSQESCNAMYKVLCQHYQTVGISIINNRADLDLLVLKQPDLVFLGMKYLPSHKIWLSSFLTQHGIAHTGSPQSAIEHERNKPLAKQRVMRAGIRTPQFVLIDHRYPIVDTAGLLRFPLFVKPASLGGGKGIDEDSVVSNLAELQTKVDYLVAAYEADILVEEYLPGREFSVAVLRQEDSDQLMVMPIELVAQDDARGHRVLSQQVKSSNAESALSVDAPQVRQTVTQLAERVFRALGARDYGRIDIRMDASGLPHFLEANLIPSLITGYGSFPKACLLNLGLEYESMILHITRLGLQRVALPSRLLAADILI